MRRAASAPASRSRALARVDADITLEPSVLQAANKLRNQDGINCDHKPA